MITNSYKKGFTLIELLVVISIIALLSSVVMVSIGSARQKARDSYRKETLVQFQNALQIYASEHDYTYPNVGWSNFSALNSSYNLVPRYLPSALVDEKEGQAVASCGTYGFLYGSYDNGKNYKIVACSELSTEGDSLADANFNRPNAFAKSSSPEVPDGGCAVTNYTESSPYHINLWPACW